MVEAVEPTALGTSDKTWEDMSDTDKKWARENSMVGGYTYTVMAADNLEKNASKPLGRSRKKNSNRDDLG